MRITIEDLKVKVRIVKDSKVLGTATVYNSPWVYRGYLIVKSQYENRRGEFIWVKPPSFKGPDGKFHGIIFLEDTTLWRKLEEKILDEYQKEKEKPEVEEKTQLTDEDYEKINEKIK